MQHALVVSLIGFFGSWAIVLGQSCYAPFYAPLPGWGHMTVTDNTCSYSRTRHKYSFTITNMVNVFQIRFLVAKVK